MTDTIRSVKRLEDEIAELERLSLGEQEGEEELEQVGEEDTKPAVQEEVKETVELGPEDKEEASFKKRYSDLRRHSQKVADDLKEAQATISGLKNSTSGLPSAEEAATWAKENPKAAAIIRSIAANEASSSVEEVSAIKEKLNRAEQEARIFKVHNDYEEVTGEDSFHEWAESQPASVQKLIFSNSADDVIWSLSQYKKEMAKTPDAKKEAAKAVSSKATSAEPRDASKGRFTESQVGKMSVQEYEKHEEAINASVRDGTFVYDRSGAAR